MALDYVFIAWLSHYSPVFILRGGDDGSLVWGKIYPAIFHTQGGTANLSFVALFPTYGMTTSTRRTRRLTMRCKIWAEYSNDEASYKFVRNAWVQSDLDLHCTAFAHFFHSSWVLKSLCADPLQRGTAHLSGIQESRNQDRIFTAFIQIEKDKNSIRYNTVLENSFRVQMTQSFSRLWW